MCLYLIPSAPLSDKQQGQGISLGDSSWGFLRVPAEERGEGVTEPVPPPGKSHREEDGGKEVPRGFAYSTCTEGGVLSVILVPGD